MDKSGTNGAEFSRRVAGAIKSIVNARGLQLECARVLHETVLGKEKERSRFRVVQMDNLKGVLVIRRMDRVLNAWIREFCGMTKVVNKNIDGGSAM